MTQERWLQVHEIVISCLLYVKFNTLKRLTVIMFMTIVQ